MLDISHKKHAVLLSFVYKGGFFFGTEDVSKMFPGLGFIRDLGSIFSRKQPWNKVLKIFIFFPQIPRNHY